MPRELAVIAHAAAVRMLDAVRVVGTHYLASCVRARLDIFSIYSIVGNFARGCVLTFHAVSTLLPAGVCCFIGLLPSAASVAYMS